MVNEVIIRGLVLRDVEYSHRTKGKNYYKVFVTVARAKSKKGSFDIIPCIVEEDMVEDFYDKFVEVTGRFGSWRYYGEDGYRHVSLDVYASDIRVIEDGGYMNDVTLRGVVVKNGGMRKTPFGSEITDLLVVVNHDDGSDYLPCICWNTGARYAEALNVGDSVEIVGQIQSREYEKNGEKKTVYEVSVFRIDLICT